MTNTKYVNINGRLVTTSKALLGVFNRAFRYGDALFETIRVINGKPVNLEAHFERLKKGMDILEFDKSEGLTFHYLAEQIQETIHKNNITAGGKVRLTVYRDASGTYIPDSNKKAFVIEADPLTGNEFTLNPTGISLGICKKLNIQKSIFSGIKTANALLYVIAGIEARKQGLDDIILLNHHNRICEAISSNIFLYKNNTLYTPAIDEGCVAGTMRKTIINIAQNMGMTVFECTLVQGNLQQVDEIWLSNAIQGIKWVGELNGKSYGNFTAQKIINELNNLFG